MEVNIYVINVFELFYWTADRNTKLSGRVPGDKLIKQPPSELEFCLPAGGSTFTLEVIAALGDFWTSAEFCLRLHGLRLLAALADRSAVDGELNHSRTRKGGSDDDSNGPRCRTAG